MTEGLLAIIGGTGLDWRGAGSPLCEPRDETVATRWGEAAVTRARLETDDDARDIVFLHRHSPDGTSHIPPHRINYRANIAALTQLGVTAILASNAVGSLHRDWKPGDLVLLDDFIDCTKSRPGTFFDEGATHIDVTEPYCPRMRNLLRDAAAELGFDLKNGGTYLCSEGPRFETPAEIRAYAKWGADVVGMTGVPEIVLARETNISYAAVAIVTNAAAGILPQPLTQHEVETEMRAALPRVTALFLVAARTYRDDPTTESRNVTERGIK